MKLVADKCGVDWDMAVEGFIRDGRIGYNTKDSDRRNNNHTTFRSR